MRAHFGCDSLTGAFLEDLARTGTGGNHFEQRVFNVSLHCTVWVYRAAYPALAKNLIVCHLWHCVYKLARG